MLIKRKGESDSHLILRFRRWVLRERIIDEFMDKSRFLKPSEKLKLKRKRREAEMKEL